MKSYLKNIAVKKFMLIIIVLLAGFFYVSEINPSKALSQQFLNLQSPGDIEPPGPTISASDPITLKWSNGVSDSTGMPYIVRITKKPFGSNDVVFQTSVFRESFIVRPGILKEDKFYCWSVAPPGGVIVFSDCLYFNTGGEWDPEPQPEEYSIIIRSNPPEAGYPLGEGTYKDGDEVSLSVHTILEGYKFKNWTEGGKVVHEELEYEFIAEQDRELTINFYMPLQASLYGFEDIMEGLKVKSRIYNVEYAGNLLDQIGFNVYEGTQDTDDKYKALSRLPNDIIFFFRYHSNPEKLVFPGENDMESKDIQGINLEDLQLVVLAGCNTAKNIDCNNNILRSFINSGARVGVGFSDFVTTTGTAHWSDVFWEDLVKKQLTIHEASLSATYKYIKIAPWQKGLKDDMPVTYPEEKAREITIEDILEGAER